MIAMPDAAERGAAGGDALLGLAARLLGLRLAHEPPSGQPPEDRSSGRSRVAGGHLTIASVAKSVLTRKEVAALIEPLRVRPGSKVVLGRDFDPASDAGLDKLKAKQLLAAGVELLAEYQERLAAQDTYGLLVVLQALDAAGKDGTIRHVMSGVNPQGVRVESFKVPSAEELDHDYLWRYARAAAAARRDRHLQPLPLRGGARRPRASGEPRAAEAADSRRARPHVWKRRYREINDWERYLVDNGFRVVKLFLNLSKEEQRLRFLRRIDLPEHNWKFSAADVEERRSWDDYQQAFSEMLAPHEHRVGAVVRDPGRPQVVCAHCGGGGDRQRLIEIDPQYPTLDEAALEALQEAKALLEAEAPSESP